MTFHFRPAKRENTPLIIGLAGPTKSGKTYSAHRLAVGLAQGAPIVMINAEGAKGHQYADRFTYIATDIGPPYRPGRYTEVLKAAVALDPKPGVVIIDSMSHMHDGPGGLLEYHESELDRLAGQDMKARLRSTWSAWVKPKAEENIFIYEALDAPCHQIWCFRAKEKLKLVKGSDPVELGWRPISSDRVTFETIFSLVLPPHCKGVPDLAISDMREPFDTIVPKGKPLSEETGRLLGEWAAGAKTGPGEDMPREEVAAAAGLEAGGQVAGASQPEAAHDNEWAAEKDVTAVLELAARVGETEHDKTVDAIAKHRAKWDGKVNRVWLGKLSAALLKKAPAADPEEESVFGSMVPAEMRS